MAVLADPSSVLDYSVDWKYKSYESRVAAGAGDGWLASGETISTSTWTVPTGITQTTPAPSNSDGLTTIWLTGGTLGQSYTVTNHITTNQGRQDERSFTVQVVDK